MIKGYRGVINIFHYAISSYNKKIWRGRPTSEHGFFLIFCEMEIKREILQSTYSKTICVGTESHNIVVAIRRLTSKTRFSQTLKCKMIQHKMTCQRRNEITVLQLVNDGNWGAQFNKRVAGRNASTMIDSHAHLTLHYIHHSFTTSKKKGIYFTTFNIKYN